ncbi:syntaxin-43-like isoform X2 [Argentina anserina]|uniref:syntaxin-43-like isoform X2 n=1 Tax=Argentina anserina TaxID=57926 RepID=UPI00217624B0|nr:syntaxin-43-like isoform X2 [Potentilla anserina]
MSGLTARNRTVLFKKYRDESRTGRPPSSSSVSTSSGGRGPVIELTSLVNQNRSYAPLSTEDPGNSRGALTVGLPPAWVDVSEEIAVNLQRARGKMTELSKAHAKALLPKFVDGRDDQRLIESLTQEITGLITRSQKRLQRLSAAGPSEDANVRKNVQVSLATDLQSLSNELRKKQSNYLKSLKRQNEGQDGVDLEMNLNGSRSRMDGDDADETMYHERETAQIKKHEAFTAEREREIHQVVESVNELAQIMKDLSVLVIDQGTIVDRIDYNIQNVASTVEDGLKQLQKAERTQKQGGMVMCATVLVIMCAVMLVLLVLKEIIF